jgi:TolA-binding protein
MAYVGISGMSDLACSNARVLLSFYPMLSPTAIRKAVFLSLSLTLSGCAGRMAHPDSDSNHPQTPPTAQSSAPSDVQTQAPVDPRMSVAGLNARLEAMDAKVAAMNEKLDSTQHTLDNFLTAHSPKMSGVDHSANEAAGSPVAASDANSPGYIQDGAVQLFRKANILFESQRYAESNLAYTNFLERFPDHPLAGLAQFKVGEGYFRKKEYRQAVQEFQKVLTSYDRSPAISATLRDLAESEDALGKTQEAARYRQQLTSLFPSSPAAQNIQSAVAAPQAPAMAPAPQGAEPQAAAPTLPLSALPQGQADAPPKHDLDSPPPTAPMNEKPSDKPGDKPGEKP